VDQKERAESQKRTHTVSDQRKRKQLQHSTEIEEQGTSRWGGKNKTKKIRGCDLQPKELSWKRTPNPLCASSL